MNKFLSFVIVFQTKPIRSIANGAKKQQQRSGARDHVTGSWVKAAPTAKLAKVTLTDHVIVVTWRFPSRRPRSEIASKTLVMAFMARK